MQMIFRVSLLIPHSSRRRSRPQAAAVPRGGRRCCDIALAASALPANATATTVVPTAAPASANPRLQALLDELVAAGAPGVLAVVDDGQHTWRLSSGAGRLDPRRPLSPAARFRVGSITKTFVATVVLQLVQEGQLRLDDSVERWLPGLVPAGGRISVRMLLNHTSGIFNYTDEPAFIQYLAHHRYSTIPPRRLVQLAVSHPPVFPPGHGWSYSNTNYILTGLIIEAATGRSVQQLLAHRIFQPLGLSSTEFPTAAVIRGYHSHGYLPADNPFLPSPDGRPIDVTAINPSWAWAAGAVTSTATDLATFYTALLGGHLLPPALLRAMETTVNVNPVFGYGLGLYTQRGPCGTIWGHDGGVPGFETIAYSSKAGDRHVTMMVNITTDNRTGPLFLLASQTAVCQMFGMVPPSQLSTTAPPRRDVQLLR